MRKLVLALTACAILSACQPRHPSDEARASASKAAENARAKKNAEEDAIQAQRQLDLVRERSKSGVSKTEPSAPPKK
jgi:outer membrane biogenesis lipoprotein LolB